eukprot:6395225-Amphidinium_carterae.1
MNMFDMVILLAVSGMVPSWNNPSTLVSVAEHKAQEGDHHTRIATAFIPNCLGPEFEIRALDDFVYGSGERNQARWFQGVA